MKRKRMNNKAVSSPIEFTIAFGVLVIAFAFLFQSVGQMFVPLDVENADYSAKAMLISEKLVKDVGRTLYGDPDWENDPGNVSDVGIAKEDVMFDAVQYDNGTINVVVDKFPKQDLAVVNLLYTPKENLHHGDTISVAFNVKNVGNNNSGKFSWDVFIDDNLSKWGDFTDSLSPGSSVSMKNIPVVIPSNNKSKYTLKVEIFPVDDDNPDNNYAETYVHVGEYYTVPDLAVVSLDYSPKFGVDDGEYITVDFTVENINAKVSDGFSWNVSIEGVIQKSGSYSNGLAENEKKSFTGLSIKIPTQGKTSYTLKAWIVPWGDDADYSNNYMTRSVSTTGSTPGVSPTVKTVDPFHDDIEYSWAEVYGNLTSTGSYSNVYVWFTWREQGAPSWSNTTKSIMNSTGLFDETLTNLKENTTYEFEAHAQGVGGSLVVDGGVKNFTTKEHGIYSKLLVTTGSSAYGWNVFRGGDVNMHATVSGVWGNGDSVEVWFVIVGKDSNGNTVYGPFSTASATIAKSGYNNNFSETINIDKKVGFWPTIKPDFYYTAHAAMYENNNQILTAVGNTNVCHATAFPSIATKWADVVVGTHGTKIKLIGRVRSFGDISNLNIYFHVWTIDPSTGKQDDHYTGSEGISSSDSDAEGGYTDSHIYDTADDLTPPLGQMVRGQTYYAEFMAKYTDENGYTAYQTGGAIPFKWGLVNDIQVNTVDYKITLDGSVKFEGYVTNIEQLGLAFLGFRYKEYGSDGDLETNTKLPADSNVYQANAVDITPGSRPYTYKYSVKLSLNTSKRYTFVAFARVHHLLTGSDDYGFGEERNTQVYTPNNSLNSLNVETLSPTVDGNTVTLKGRLNSVGNLAAGAHVYFFINGEKQSWGNNYIYKSGCPKEFKKMYTLDDGDYSFYAAAYNIPHGWAYGNSASFRVSNNNNGGGGTNNDVSIHSPDVTTLSHSDVTIGSCFLAGTKVTMADGSTKNIENIHIGDMVKSFDSATGKFKAAKVVKVFHHAGEEMPDYYMIVNGKLRVTPNHVILINGEWKAAGNLNIGDTLKSGDGRSVKVLSIERIFKKVPTYNLETLPYHTYIADNFVVHNAKSSPTASISGRLDDTGNSPCTVGFYWKGPGDTRWNQRDYGSKSSTGKFGISIDISKEGWYEYEAYAKNSMGTATGSVESFKVTKSSCFLAGTKVLMADGSTKNIENIHIGDMVKSLDMNTMKWRTAKVVRVTDYSPEEMTGNYYVVLNKEIKMTGNQVVYADNSWKEAKDLKRGDVLGLYNGTVVMTVDKIYNRVPTYEIELDHYHNYEVVLNCGAMIMVHNATATAVSSQLADDDTSSSTSTSSTSTSSTSTSSTSTSTATLASDDTSSSSSDSGSVDTSSTSTSSSTTSNETIITIDPTTTIQPYTPTRIITSITTIANRTYTNTTYIINSLKNIMPKCGNAIMELRFCHMRDESGNEYANYTRITIKKTISEYGIVKKAKLDALAKLDYSILREGLGLDNTPYQVGIVVKSQDGKVWNCGVPITANSNIVSMYSRNVVIDGNERAKLTVAVFG